MKNFTRVSFMLTLWAFVSLVSVNIKAQTPSYISTNIGGNYVLAPFTSVFDISSQYRVQASSSQSSGTGILEFTDVNSFTSTTNVWRAYTSGQLLIGFDSLIDPFTQPASARYNSNEGGQSILLPAITAGNYYTVNIMTNRGFANDTMAVLETTYNPVVISTVSQSPSGSPVSSLCPVTVTAVMAANPSVGEYIYLRYSIDNFQNVSTVIAMTVSNDTATATIPSFPGGTNVQYYVFSSPYPSLLTSGQASGYYDCLSLNYNNNTGANYSYNVTATAVPSVSITALHNNFCAEVSVPDTFIATPSNAGSSPSYQWYKNGAPEVGATGDTLIDPALNPNDTVYVVMTGSVQCAVPDTSNAIGININNFNTSSVTISVSQTAICSGGIDTFTATPSSTTSTVISPTYQWYKNWVPVGTDSSIYIDASLHNNDSIVVTMISGLSCDVGDIDTSNTIYAVVTPVPVSGTLTPSPAASEVCTGALVSATATAGSGGAGTVADSLQYRYDGGAWLAYTSATSLTTAGHTSVDIQTFRTASASGCSTSTPNVVSWLIEAQPVSGTLNPSPAGGALCSGEYASATLTPGTGGAGTVTDVLEYRVDGGAWQPYAAGTGISSSGHTSLDIRTYRTATGSDCNQSTPNTTSWTINPGPVNNIGVSPIRQCGGYVILNAGNAGSSYLWSNGSSNQIDTFSTSGALTVIVTNSFTCVDTFTKYIYIKQVPVVNLGPDQNLCADSTLLDAGNPGDSYLWTGGSTGQFLTVYSSGTYTVTVTDTASQCAASDSVQIDFGTVPVINLGHDTAICGGTLTLSAFNTNSTYLWSTGASTSQITVSSTGNYSVTVTSPTNCTASASVFISVYPQPSLGADVTDSICPGAMADLYNYYQGSGLTLTYSTPTPASADTGTYTVVGTNSNGCTDTALITITYRQKPSAGPDVSDSVCVGATLDLDTVIVNNGFATYTWNTATPQTAGPGTYQLIVSNTQGCTDTALATVINRVPQPTVNLGPDTTQCGGTVTLSAAIPSGSYAWSTGSSSSQITVNSTGIYSVTVTNSNGCSASSSTQVTIYPQPNLGPDVTDSICPFSRANLYNYYVNSGLALTYSTATPSSVDTGTYTVVGTNSNGCSDTAYVTIIYRQKPNAGGNKTDSICPGYTFNLLTLYPNTGYASYVWNTANPSAVDTGSYMLVVSNASGCTDTAIATIIQSQKPNAGGNKTDSVCRGYTYNLTTLYPDSGYKNYAWTGVVNDSAVSPGVYQLVVTNASGCTDTVYATIIQKVQPVVTIPAYPNLCSTNPAFMLTGATPVGGIYYVDYTQDSIFNTPVLGPGIRHVLYIYTNASGCTDSASHDVTIYPQPQIIDTIGLPTSCTGSGLIDLDSYFSPAGGVFSGAGVSGVYFYPTLAPVGSDSITYIYTDQNGCMDTAGRRIEIIPSVKVSLHTAQSNLTICQGQSITFTASGAMTYQFFVNDSAWTSAGPEDTFTTSALVNHDQVYVVGSNGCSIDTSDIIIIDVTPLPTVTAGPDTTIELGQTVQLYTNATGATSLIYFWSPDSFINHTNIPNPVYSGPDTITFQVKVTDTYGCSASASVTINVNIPDNVILPNIITPNGDGFNDAWVLNPKINLAGSHLVIFDRWGQVVYEVNDYANNWQGTYMNTGNKVPDGTYYYTLTVPAQDNHTYEGPINILSSK